MVDMHEAARLMHEVFSGTKLLSKDFAPSPECMFYPDGAMLHEKFSLGEESWGDHLVDLPIRVRLPYSKIKTVCQSFVENCVNQVELENSSVDIHQTHLCDGKMRVVYTFRSDTDVAWESPSASSNMGKVRLPPTICTCIIHIAYMSVEPVLEPFPPKESNFNKAFNEKAGDFSV